MSIESNKMDFEKALASLEGWVGDIDGVVNKDFFMAVSDVISEYNHHLKEDIEDLVDLYEEARNE